MALTFTMNLDRGNRVWKLGSGLVVKQVDMTTGTATADYTSVGFPLTASTVGYSKVFGILDCAIRDSAGAIKPVSGLYDKTNGTVRLFKGSVEQVGSLLADGDIVRLTMIGV